MPILFKLILLLWLCTSANAGMYQSVSLDLENANLSDGLRLLAGFMRLNVIIDPNVQGNLTLHLEKADARAAFNAVLQTHHLAKSVLGNIWYIAPANEILKQRQSALKLQAMEDATDTMQLQLVPMHYAKATDIVKLLMLQHGALLTKRGLVTADARTNTLCIVDIASHVVPLLAMVKKLDVPIKQIAIEARLVSVDSDFEQDLGVNFTTRFRASENGTSNGWAKGLGQYSIAVAHLADGSLLDIKLAALEDAGHANLISNPSLFTANQQPAAIETGEEVPYQEVSESGGTAIAFKKAVLALKVIPQVLPGGNVLLQLQISQDRPSNKMVLGMPTINTRQITTNVVVKNHQTIVLGGIYESNQENGERRLPFLGQLPLLGVLFRQHSTRQNKRELLIFVTPTIVSIDDAAENDENRTNQYFSDRAHGRWQNQRRPLFGPAVK